MGCILLVDDDKATNFLHRRTLTRMKVAEQIIVARNGVEAMEYLRKCLEPAYEPDHPCPDLILLDINMPMVNGWEFLEAYETLPPDFRDKIKIIMLSTSFQEADTERIRQFPCIRSFLHKPLTHEKVEQVMELL